MIGFKDNPRPCGEYAAFYTSLSPLPIVYVLIWNLRENKIELGPVTTTSAAYLAWIAGKTSKGSPLFDFFQNDYAPHKLRPDLIDTAETDYHRIGNPGPYLTISLEESYYAQVLLPPVDPLAPIYGGLRTEKHDEVSALASLWVFNGPRGVMGSMQAELLWSLPPGDVNEYDYCIHAIPWWTPTSTANPTEGKTPLMPWMLGRRWYGSSIDGEYSANSIIEVTMVQYVPCDYREWHPYGWLYYGEWTLYEREVVVQAVAIAPPGGTSGYDYATAPINTVLSVILREMVGLTYDANSIPRNEIRGCVISTAILQ